GNRGPKGTACRVWRSPLAVEVRLFRSPNPIAWNRIHKRLLDWHRIHCLSVKDEPPVPLILAGWVFSSSSQRHNRWLQTVEWAQRHGCAGLVAVASSEFE